MGVAVDKAASKGGSGPSSPQSYVSRRSTSSGGSHDSEKIQKTKNDKLQSKVDAMLMPKVESLGPEIRPNNERKLETKHVKDDGQTFAANPHAPRVGPEYMPPMSQLYYYPPSRYGWFDCNDILEKDRNIANLQDELFEKDQTITELTMKLENKEGEVCTKDRSLREKEAELANFRTIVYQCEAKNHQLKEKLRASQGSISFEKEQQKMQLAHCAEWHRQQGMMRNQQLKAEFGEQYSQLWFVHQKEVERSGRLEQQLLREIADNKQLAEQLQRLMPNARERTQTHLDESPIPQNGSQDVTQLGQNNGNQQDVNGGGSMNTNSGVSTQAALAVLQISAPSQTNQDLTRSDGKYEHDISVDGQALHSSHLDVHVSPETEPDSVISPSAGEEQVLSQENNTNTIVICWGSTDLTSEIRLDTIGQNNDAKEQLTDRGLQGEVAKVEEPSIASDASVSI